MGTLASVSLSFCMVVRDEAHNLPRCLDSVKDLADELVVVDTGSTDATVSVALGYGAVVVPFEFSVPDFSAARNCALARARGRWILMLDGDEVLDREGVPTIREIVSLVTNTGAGYADVENTAYFLERHNFSAAAGSSTRDYVVRLFPNRAEYRYRGRVHETIDASILAGGGQLRKTGIRIEHSFSSDPEMRRRKNHRYIGILREEIAADPEDFTRLDFLAAEYHQLGRFAEAAEVAERIAEVRPMDARAHLFAGMYHLLYVPDLVRARADLVRALALRPGYPEAESFLELLSDKERESR
jgi:glycosyltransferase involved in cell wall biosynthesis